MEAMVEAIQDVVPAAPEAEAQPVSTQPGDAVIETQLTQEISTLWSEHTRLSGNRRATAKELRLVRARLAERLHEMKSLLSRPGRAGQWRGWLKQQDIPRSTADRLASRHAETLGSTNENVPTGATPEPTEADVERLFNSLLPRLRSNLTTASVAYDFVVRLVGSFGLACDRQEDGILVFNPSANESSGAAVTLPAAEQAAAVGDAGISAVA